MRQEFTAQTRKEIKRTCKGRVINNLGRCIGINFLYLVPFVLLFIMVYLAMFGRVFAMVMAGYTDEYMLSMALTRSMNTVWLVMLLMIVISGPLTFGMMRFYLGLQRGEDLGVSTLFKPFTSLRSIWTGIKMEFCMTFRSFLWMLGPTIVYMVLAFSLAFSAAISGNPNGASAVLTVLNILYIIALIPIEVKVMTYNAGWVVLCNDETHSVWDATREASAAFKGQYGKLFVFVLSFIGWYILLLGVTYLCIGLGVAGIMLVAGGTGIAIAVAAFIAAVCLTVLLGAFVNAYELTSFFGMYEYLSKPAMPDMGSQNTPFTDSWPGQGGDGTPQ
ncbi:MAG TPA: DUF975 family protein [Candidatus Agathobaculum merdipullorum]|nr:DUF975 family protein [Candidatus Agathobaculum merdipullorum]